MISGLKTTFFFSINLSHEQVRTQPRDVTVRMHFKYNEHGLWTELQVCSAQLTPVHGCLSSTSAISLHWVHRLLTSMISTPALLALTIGTSISLKISFLGSLSAVAFGIDPVKEMRSKKWVKGHTVLQFLRHFISVTSKINFMNHLLNLRWELFLLSLTQKFNLEWERRGEGTNFFFFCPHYKIIWKKCVP